MRTRLPFSRSRRIHNYTALWKTTKQEIAKKKPGCVVLLTWALCVMAGTSNPSGSGGVTGDQEVRIFFLSVVQWHGITLLFRHKPKVRKL